MPTLDLAAYSVDEPANLDCQPETHIAARKVAHNEFRNRTSQTASAYNTRRLFFPGALASRHAPSGHQTHS